MKRKIFVGLLSTLVLGMVGIENVQAVPVDGVISQQEQPSGEQFTLLREGDENFSYYVTNDGKVLTRGSDDYWYYAAINGRLKTSTTKIVASKSKYLIDDAPTNALKEQDIVVDQVADLYEEKNPSATIANAKSLNTDHNLLVILVEYDDVKLKYSDEDWKNLIFANKEKTLNDYYQTQTNGNISIIPAKENSGVQDDGIIKVSVNKNHPNFGDSQDANEKSKKRAQTSQEAIIEADDYVDYSSYDKNNNGTIEADELHIMVIIAGEEASKTPHNGVKRKYPSVWGVRGGLYTSVGDYRVDLDDVKLRYYTQFGEQHYQSKSNDEYVYTQATLGIIAHEFGHDLGLPDLYNIGYTDENKVTHKKGTGLGYVSVMASGSWGRIPGENSGATPVGLDAYSKLCLGVPFEEITSSVEDKLVQSQGRGLPTILKIPTYDPKQYYLVENRQFEGYDRGMLVNNGISAAVHSGGIAAYRIDTRYPNNQTWDRQLVTVLEAGSDQYAQGINIQADPFYYIGKGLYLDEQQTEITSWTNPSSVPSYYEGLIDPNYSQQPSFYLNVSSESGNNMYLNLSSFNGKLASGSFSTEFNSTSDYFEYTDTMPSERANYKSFHLGSSTTTLSGLEYATNLEYFRGGGYNLGEIQDFSALASLNKLKYFELHSYPSFSEDQELIDKLREPVNIDFFATMPQLAHIGFAPRPVIDLTPLNKLNNLEEILIQDYAGYSRKHAVQGDPVAISKDTKEFIFVNPIKYSDHFKNSEITYSSFTVVENDLEGYDGVSAMGEIEDNKVVLKDIPTNTSEILVSINATTSDYNFSHSVTFRVPLLWK